jgi:hypothetical protein
LAQWLGNAVAARQALQIAVTKFHQYNHRWIVSVRFPI